MRPILKASLDSIMQGTSPDPAIIPPFSMAWPASWAAIDADFANNQYFGGTLNGLFSQQLVTATPTFALNADGSYSLNSGGITSIRRSNLGILVDGDRTDSARFSRDLSQVANWTLTNITAPHTAVGITGAANTANLLTCGVAGGTILQTLAASSRPWRMRPLIKRTGGVGIVELTLDNVTFTDITAQLVNGTWKRITVPDQTLLNPTFGIRMQGVGDTLIVDSFNMCGDNTTDEWGPCSPTASASVKTWRDRVASYNSDGSAVANYLKNNVIRCVYMEFAFRQAGALFATDGDFSASVGLSNVSTGAIVTANAPVVSDYQLLNTNKMMVCKEASQTRIVLNGGAVASGVGGAPDPAHTHTDLMTNGAGNLSTMGALRRVAYLNFSPSNAQMISATT